MSSHSNALQSRISNREHAPHRDEGVNVSFSACCHILTLTPRPTLLKSSPRHISSNVVDPDRHVDRPTTDFWSTTFTSLMEGIILYGAALHPNGSFPSALLRDEYTAPHPSAVSAQRGFNSIAGRPGVADPRQQHSTDQNAPTEAKVLYVDVGFFEGGSVASLGVVRRIARQSFTFVTGLWLRRRREREIKNAVAALAQLDDRTLLDLGIPRRSGVEQAVRYCRDC